MKRLIHDSEGVYMIDEECLQKKEQQEREKEMRWQKMHARNEPGEDKTRDRRKQRSLENR